MNPDRFVITDEVWAQISPILPGKPTDCEVTAKDTRFFLEAVLWRVRTGIKQPEVWTFGFPLISHPVFPI